MEKKINMSDAKSKIRAMEKIVSADTPVNVKINDSGAYIYCKYGSAIIAAKINAKTGIAAKKDVLGVYGDKLRRWMDENRVEKEMVRYEKKNAESIKLLTLPLHVSECDEFSLPFEDLYQIMNCVGAEEIKFTKIGTELHIRIGSVSTKVMELKDDTGREIIKAEGMEAKFDFTKPYKEAEEIGVEGLFSEEFSRQY